MSWQEERNELILKYRINFFFPITHEQHILFYAMSPGGLEWIPFAKQRGKNTEILALFGMREQVSKEYQFICGKISLLNETNI